MSSSIDPEKAYSSSYRPAKTYRGLSNLTFGYTIRVAQMITTILVLALAGDSLSKFATHGSMGFTMFTACLTLVYLIIFTVIALVAPHVLMIGVILVFELVLVVFWFISFIAIAAVYGPLDCEYTIGYGIWGSTYHFTSCKTGKAAIAFAAINFVLFILSFLPLALTSFKVLPAPQFWKTNDYNGLALNRPLTAVVGVTSHGNGISKDVATSVDFGNDQTTATPVINDEEPLDTGANPESATIVSNEPSLPERSHHT